LKLKATILLVLALFAFAASAVATLILPAPQLRVLSFNLTDDSEPPEQPLGDPVEGNGDPPH